MLLSVRCRLLLAAALLAAQPGMASNAFEPIGSASTVEQLLAACEAPNPMPAADFLARQQRTFHCIGYVAGIIDGFTVTRDVLSNWIGKEIQIFTPCTGDISPDEALAALKVALHKAFVSANDSARVSLYIALFKLYPCTPSK